MLSLPLWFTLTRTFLERSYTAILGLSPSDPFFEPGKPSQIGMDSAIWGKFRIIFEL
jgi:hypothetical protein